MLDLSRRGFLGATAAAIIPIARPSSQATDGCMCMLPESEAGFRKILSQCDPGHIRVLAAASGWNDSLRGDVMNGSTVLFESGAPFADFAEFELQRRGLWRDFGLKIDAPIELWRDDVRPPYVQFLTPEEARVRDFSYAIPVHGGETIARLGRLSVAASRRAGAGLFVFLGSPLGPALFGGDREAELWFRSFSLPSTLQGDLN